MSQIRLKDDAPTVAQSVSAEGREASAEHTGGGRQQISGQRVQARNALRQHPYLTAATAIVVISALAGGVLWWLNARNYESTDDAFVDARNVSVSSQVTGAITDVPVTDNQLVEPGALLVQIDPRDYQDAVAQAQAQVDQADATIANLDAQIDAQKARIDQAEKQVVQARAALTFAREEDARAQDLVRKGAGTQQQAQQTSSNLIQGQANVDSAEANAVAAQKQIPVLQTQRQGAVGQLAQAQATLAQAKVNLERTRIVAPERGRATKITAAVGANAQPGQVLMLFVPEYKWVTANYKETQLTHMRPGQPVDIDIDAYPNRRFRGHIESIQAGSGAAFSLLPPENATGNFVKVVQRVPVKIVFDEGTDPEHLLRPGLSCVPTVYTK